MNTPRVGVHESRRLVFMKPSVGGGDESYDSNATPKIKTAGPMGRQFREWTDVRSADQTRQCDRARLPPIHTALMANPRARVAPRSSGSPHAGNDDTATQPASSGPPLTGSDVNTDASNLFITVSQVASLGTEQTEVDVTVRNQSGSLVSVGQPLLGTAATGIMTLWPPSGGATTASYSTNRASVSFNPADCQSWISWPGGTPSTCVFNLESGG